MNLDLLFAILFYGLLILFFLKHKDKFEIQGKIIALYKTKLGLKLMDRLAKLKGFVFFGYLGVVVGFLGMGYIFYILISKTVGFVLNGGIPPLAPVLPGVTIPGMPTLGFWHWIIAIFVVAVLHEFSHGILARAHGLKVKSSGFALFGPILAAFVEPDEKQMEKASKKSQLSVYAAGPFMNIVTGFVFLLLLNYGGMALQENAFDINGIMVGEIVDGSPAFESGMEAPLIIESVNGQIIDNPEVFVSVLDGIEPGDTLEFGTDLGDYSVITVEHPDNSSKGYVGISGLTLNYELEEGRSSLWNGIFWINLLLLWLFVISIGIALFNLLPIGPVDGGRMFYVLCLSLFDKSKAQKIWTFVSFFILVLIIINLLPWITKLFVWLFHTLVFLITLF